MYKEDKQIESNEMLNCPLCKGTLNYVQNVEITFKIEGRKLVPKIGKNDQLDFVGDPSINCNFCGEDSQTSDVLNKRLKTICNFYHK